MYKVAKLTLWELWDLYSSGYLIIDISQTRKRSVKKIMEYIIDYHKFGDISIGKYYDKYTVLTGESYLKFILSYLQDSNVMHVLNKQDLPLAKDVKLDKIIYRKKFIDLPLEYKMYVLSLKLQVLYIVTSTHQPVLNVYYRIYKLMQQDNKQLNRMEMLFATIGNTVIRALKEMMVNQPYIMLGMADVFHDKYLVNSQLNSIDITTTKLAKYHNFLKELHALNEVKRLKYEKYMLIGMVYIWAYNIHLIQNKVVDPLNVYSLIEKYIMNIHNIIKDYKEKKNLHDISEVRLRRYVKVILRKDFNSLSTLWLGIHHTTLSSALISENSGMFSLAKYLFFVLVISRFDYDVLFHKFMVFNVILDKIYSLPNKYLNLVSEEYWLKIQEAIEAVNYVINNYTEELISTQDYAILYMRDTYKCTHCGKLISKPDNMVVELSHIETKQLKKYGYLSNVNYMTYHHRKCKGGS